MYPQGNFVATNQIIDPDLPCQDTENSWYALDVEGELRLLRVARALGEDLPVRIVPTLLALHALPPEYRDRRDDYVALVAGQLIPRAASEKLATSVDAFSEAIAFTPAEVERVFQAAARHGLPVRLHAEQLSNHGGAALAAKYKALSADHLEHQDTDHGPRRHASALRS